MNKHAQNLYLLCTFVIALALGDVCVFQECECTDTTVNCENSQLTKIPAIVPSSTHYTILNLNMNEITEIPAGSLPPNLTSVSFLQNPTTNISESAFNDSAFTLGTLTFSWPGFTRIPDAFRWLKVLTTLNIQNANIQDWNDKAMQNIGQTLVTLDLENVGLTSWPSCFESLTRLTTLTIIGGSISSLPDNALDNVASSLVSLSIANNKLTTVPKALSKLTALQNLNIQQNKIVDLTYLPQESKLTTLMLSNNMVSDASHLSNVLYPYKDSLATLELNSNRLTAIPNITFLALIWNLDFGNNRLSDPYSGAIPPSVGYIYFSFNLLPAIPRVIRTLYSVPELTISSNSITQIQALDIPLSTTEADLGYNLINELSDNSFPVNCKISNLHLNNNPIIAISRGAFINLGWLNEIDLTGSRLTRMPLALSSLTSLYVLDMSDTPSLICTCQERNLTGWILSLASVNVQGNCGLMNIYDFFSKLTPNCPP